MKPIDYRDATWADVQERLTDLRMQAYLAWVECGPGTTREVAERAAMSLLTFRPRTTELFQLGVVVLADGADGAASTSGGMRGREGVYQALSIREAQMLFFERCAEARSGVQAQLQLT